jgi:hypothetical protein
MHIIFTFCEIPMANTDIVQVVLQEGGSSSELYLHVFDTEEEARNFRLSCNSSGYRTTNPIPVSRALAESDEFDVVVGKLLQETLAIDYARENEVSSPSRRFGY